MKHLISFSGGKDSTALICWAILNLPEFETVFCDTKWEHPTTYEYIEYINEKLLKGKLITVTSEKHDGFIGLAHDKKRFPSARARFCTEALKLEPMKKHIQKYKDAGEEVIIYTGVRADESYSRSKLPEEAWADYYDCMMKRPLLYKTANQCFEMIKAFGVEPNPLYKNGMKRVGCYPCIMTGLKELKQAYKFDPSIKDKLIKEEEKLGRSFFSPDKIPDRFHSGYDPKSDKTFPTAEDVFEYIDDSDQGELFEESEGHKCMSYYSICE